MPVKQPVSEWLYGLSTAEAYYGRLFVFMQASCLKEVACPARSGMSMGAVSLGTMLPSQ